MERRATDALAQGGLDAHLAAFEAAPLPQLRADWKRLTGRLPPIGLRRDLLMRALAYKLQERAFGGLDSATRKRLDQIAASVERGQTRGVAPAPRLRPGTALTRDWQGRAHTVLVLEQGFEYAGQIYKSLSAIARAITGTRWSGPAFFGLRRTASGTGRN